jgi:hypothetical protein
MQWTFSADWKTNGVLHSPRCEHFKSYKLHYSSVIWKEIKFAIHFRIFYFPIFLFENVNYLIHWRWPWSKICPEISLYLEKLIWEIHICFSLKTRRPRGRFRHNWEENVLNSISSRKRSGEVDCIHVAQENVQELSVVATAVNLRVRKGRKFFSSWGLQVAFLPMQLSTYGIVTCMGD